MIQVQDEELLAKATQAVKENIGNLLHVPFRYFTWLFGPQNFVSFSKKPNQEKMLKYSELVEVVPIHLHDNEGQMRQALQGLDGIVFTGGNNLFFDPLSLEEFNKYYQPDGTPKTIPKHRFERNLLKMIKVIIEEVKRINSSGKFLPLWGTCQGFQMIVMAQSSSEMNFDTFDDDFGHTRLARKIPDKRIQSEFKKYSFSEMLSSYSNNLKNEKSLVYFHNLGFTIPNIEADSQFTSEYDLLYTSSQNDFTRKKKAEKDPFRKPGDLYMYNPDELDPVFLAIFEHKFYPIFGTQFHSEIPFEYVGGKYFPNADQVRKDNIIFSKFLVSIILREKLSDNHDDKKLLNILKNKFTANISEDLFKFFEESIEESLPLLQEKLIRDIGQYEFENDNRNHQTRAKAPTRISQNDDENDLDSLLSMVVVDTLKTYHYAGVIWK